MSDRPYDVVLFGATGFTGQLVAERLARSPIERWALAGRDPHKLRDVKMGLVGAVRSAGSVGTEIASADDPASLDALARKTRILVSTVGPYLKHGAPVVAAAVGAGSHYLDITGEAAFVAQTRRAHDRRAQQQGLKIVNCCGFDAIPADLGAQWTASQLPDSPRRIRSYLEVRAHPSGGSWASLVGALATGPTGPSGLRRPGRRPPRWHRVPEVAGGGYALPLPVVDLAIVRRSAAEQPEVYGPDFVYGHYLRLPSRRRRWRTAVGYGALSAISRVRPARALLERRFSAGQGPDDEARARSYFELTLVGEAGRDRVVTQVRGGDPGYTETSRMLAAAATLLATAPEALPDRAGVLTPALAFGAPLRERLNADGLTFEVIGG